MKNKVLNINIFMFILIFLMLLALEIDYLTFFFKLNYIISFFICLVFNFIIIFLLKKKINVTNNFEKKDILFFGILFLVFIVTIVYPDRTFDSFNYHLYLQENPFGNKIGYDFFAGKNLNSFSFAFPDRLFYLFRFFLGYRLGVILNYLLITIIYYQVKEILRKIMTNAKDITIVIMSILVSTSISLIDIVDSYYIDIISAVLLLEIFRLLLVEKIDDKNNTFLFGYFSLLFGFSFVTKISNLFILIVFFILYVVKNRNIKKYINLKNIIITILLLLLPFILYMIYNIIETGNPVFPFYNTIFKSKYFGNWDWLDKRFGPRSNIEVLIYPLIMFFNKKLTCDIAIIEPIWSLGYFVSIFYIISFIIKKIKKQEINKEKYYLVISTFIIYLVWAKFQLGYTRYGFISLILGTICSFMFIYEVYKKKIFSILIILLLCMGYNYTYSIRNYMFLKRDWIYNNFFNSYCSYRYNLKNLFSKGDEVKVEFEEGSIWGIIYNNSGLAETINSDIPIININDSADNDYTKEMLDKRLNEATHIYTLVDSLDFDNFFERLNKTEFKIINVEKVITSSIICRKDSFTYIFELSKNSINSNNYENISSLKEIDVENNKKIKFFIGLGKWFNSSIKENFKITITGNDELIKEIEINKNGMLELVELDVSDYKKITINNNGYNLMILNLEVLE